LNDRTKSFLKHAYKQFYFSKAHTIEFPPDMESREFGYIPFDGSMVRHISFRSPGEAVAELLKQTPSSVYCSNARYNAPTLPMDEKGWNGAELIFDIDSTDIPTPCKKGHDIWYCTNCWKVGRLPKPTKCPDCASGVAEFKGTCEICLGASKDHAERVIGFLTDDFGVSRKDINVYFSGNRGYHLHVFDNRFDMLEQGARAEIADYLRGDSLPSIQTLASVFRRKSVGGETSSGWMKKIAIQVAQRRQGYAGTIQKLVSEAISSQRALVDASVTTDIHRVFRLAGTLHGNTGMCKKRVMTLDDFDPMIEAVVLSPEPVRIQVTVYPRFTMNGVTFGPYKSTIVTLPAYAAVPILARGMGEAA
jgi:DNA primase small subunit